MTFNFHTGIPELFIPFQRYLPKEATHLKVTREFVGYEQWIKTESMVDENGEEVLIPQNDKLDELAKLWDQFGLISTFRDWLQYIPGEILFQNMQSDTVTEQVFFGIKID